MEVFNKFQANWKYWNILSRSASPSAFYEKEEWRHGAALSTAGVLSLARINTFQLKFFVAENHQFLVVSVVFMVVSLPRYPSQSCLLAAASSLTSQPREGVTFKLRKTQIMSRQLLSRFYTQRGLTVSYFTCWASSCELAEIYISLFIHLLLNIDQNHRRRMLAWSDGNHCTQYEDLESGVWTRALRQTRTNEVLLSSISGVPSLKSIRLHSYSSALPLGNFANYEN